MILQNPDDFSQRLAETIAWCKLRNRAASIKSNLRSPELRPVVVESNPINQWLPLLGSVFESRVENVQDVSNRRRQLLRERNIIVNELEGLSGGDLLAFAPDRTLSDGAAAVETNYFVDDDNVPPWDTWIDFLRIPNAFDSLVCEVLLCWVPPELVELIDFGIVVNPENCIDWARNSAGDLTTELKELRISD